MIDQVFSSDEVLSLMNACDAYVSLHRSEGLGLTMAEAMLMGKPVIATSFSGNIDFMNDENSLACVVRAGETRSIPFRLTTQSSSGRSLRSSMPRNSCAAFTTDREWAREIGARGKVERSRVNLLAGRCGPPDRRIASN